MQLINRRSSFVSGDFYTKTEVDAIIAGLPWRSDVEAATSAADGNISLSPAPATIDGVTLVSGKSYLPFRQTAGEENGVYTFDGADLIRRSDLDTSGELEFGAVVKVKEGAENGEKIFILETDAPIVVDTTPLVWSIYANVSAMSAVVQNVIFLSPGHEGSSADRTGLNKYDQTKPFETLTGAMDAAASGDIIIGDKATFDEAVTWKNGVDAFFRLGSDIAHDTGTTTPVLLFDNVTCKISGHLKFDGAHTNNTDGAISVINGSNVTIQGRQANCSNKTCINVNASDFVGKFYDKSTNSSSTITYFMLGNGANLLWENSDVDGTNATGSLASFVGSGSTLTLRKSIFTDIYTNKPVISLSGASNTVRLEHLRMDSLGFITVANTSAKIFIDRSTLEMSNVASSGALRVGGGIFDIRHSSIKNKGAGEAIFVSQTAPIDVTIISSTLEATATGISAFVYGPNFTNKLLMLKTVLKMEASATAGIKANSDPALRILTVNQCYTTNGADVLAPDLINLDRNAINYPDFVSKAILQDILEHRFAAISGITQANPGVITVPSGHGFAVGDLAGLEQIVGMTELNGTDEIITAVADTTITITSDTTAFTAYDSLGVIFHRNKRFDLASDTHKYTDLIDIVATELNGTVTTQPTFSIGDRDEADAVGSEDSLIASVIGANLDTRFNRDQKPTLLDSKGITSISSQIDTPVTFNSATLMKLDFKFKGDQPKD